MSQRELPAFKYHPDPIGTGSIVASDKQCEVCSETAGVVYSGPFYAVEEVETICPWCIADGVAAARFDGVFTDLSGTGWDHVPAVTKQEVMTRNPGFSGWQQEMWLAHCDDAAVFLGRVGEPELRERGPDAVEALKSQDRGYGWDEAELERYIGALDRDGEPTGYLFCCTRCAAYLGYTDSG